MRCDSEIKKKIKQKFKMLEECGEIYSAQFNNIDGGIDKLINLLSEENRDYFYELRERIYNKLEKKRKVVCVISQNEGDGKLDFELIRNGEMIYRGRYGGVKRDGESGGRELKRQKPVLRCYTGDPSRYDKCSDIFGDVFFGGGDI